MVGRISKYTYNSYKLSKISKNIHFLRIKGNYYSLTGVTVLLFMIANWFIGIPLSRRIIHENNIINKSVRNC
jgi:hypothetical protein